MRTKFFHATYEFLDAFFDSFEPDPFPQRMHALMQHSEEQSKIVRLGAANTKSRIVVKTFLRVVKYTLKKN